MPALEDFVAFPVSSLCYFHHEYLDLWSLACITLQVGICPQSSSVWSPSPAFQTHAIPSLEEPSHLHTHVFHLARSQGWWWIALSSSHTSDMPLWMGLSKQPYLFIDCKNCFCPAPHSFQLTQKRIHSQDVERSPLLTAVVQKGIVLPCAHLQHSCLFSVPSPPQHLPASPSHYRQLLEIILYETS